MKICGVNAPLAPPVAPPLQVAIKMPVFCRSSNPQQFFSAPAQATLWEICWKKPSLFGHQIEPFVPDIKARLAFVQCLWTLLRLPTTAAPRYNEGSRNDWKNLFAIKRFRYIEVLCHISYYHWGKENRSLLAVVELRRELGRVSNIN